MRPAVWLGFAGMALAAFGAIAKAAPDPVSAHSYFLQAREQERGGNDSAALALYGKAFARDARNRDLCFLYLERLKGRGVPDSAYALGKRCAGLPGKPSLSEYKILGELALRADDEKEALKFYREAHRLNEEDGDVLYILGGLYEDARDWEGYTEVTRALLPRLGYPASLMDRQLRAYARLERPDAAVALLKEAWRETGRAPYGLSLAAYYEGRGLDRSLLEIARALAAQHPAPEHDWLLARAYAAANRPDSALQACARLLKNDKDPDILYFYAYLLFDRGRYAEAYASARELAKARPEAPSVVFLQGSAAAELRRADARALLEKAVALAPLAPDYRARQAYADYVFAPRGKVPAGISGRLAYAASDSLKPEQALLLEAFARGQLARLLEPRAPGERRAVLTDTAAARRHRLEAIGLFQRLVEIQGEGRLEAPGNRAARFELASHLERLGERARAEDLLRALVRQDTANALAMNYLGYMLVEHLPVTSAELAEAGSLLDRALALEPENGAYLDSKGWWHYRAGSLDSARAYLENALESIPSDPAIRGHLEEVLRAQKTAR
jgi:tetratricopeptide (TPR) repeat protein